MSLFIIVYIGAKKKKEDIEVEGMVAELKVKQEPVTPGYDGVNKDDPLYGQVKDMIKDFVKSLPCQESVDITLQPKETAPSTPVTPKVENPDQEVCA